MCLLMDALVDTLVPHSWQLCASTLSWVSCTCFCSMYSVTYFLSHTEHVHCLPTGRTHGRRRQARGVSGSPHGHSTGEVGAAGPLLPERGTQGCYHWKVPGGPAGGLF